MKLRIKENTLRLRLTQVDLAQFVASGRVEAATPFGGGASFRYALHVSPEADRLTARLEDGRIAVCVPEELAEEWAQTDRVGLEARQPLEGDQVLHVLIEKDLGCRHPQSGGEQEMFEHLRSGDSSVAE